MKANSNDTYNQVYARYYDILCAHKNYAAEAKSLNTLIESHSVGQTTPIIDIGCGTGCHAISLSYLRTNPITGFDISEAMISEAQSKDSSIDFVNGDIEKISAQKFSFAFSLFNVVNCLSTTDELFKFLTQINRILKNKSYFFFECWHQEAILKNPPIAIERKFQDDGKIFTRLAEPDISEITRSKLRLNYQIEIINNTGNRETFSTTHRLRLFSRDEISECLKAAGFRLISSHSALPHITKITEKDRMISILAST